MSSKIVRKTKRKKKKKSSFIWGKNANACSLTCTYCLSCSSSDGGVSVWNAVGQFLFCRQQTGHAQQGGLRLQRRTMIAGAPACGIRCSHLLTDMYTHACIMQNIQLKAFTRAHTPAAAFERPLVFVKPRRQSFVSLSARFVLLEVDGSPDSDVQIGRNSVLIHLSSFKYRQISLILKKKKRGLITSGCVTCV